MMLGNLLEIQKLHPVFKNSAEDTAVFVAAVQLSEQGTSPDLTGCGGQHSLLIKLTNPESLTLLCFTLTGKY